MIERFRNASLRDQVARICAHSSTKIPKLVLSTVRDQLASAGKIERAAFVVAAWCRYNEGTVDEMARAYQIEDQICQALVDASRKSSADPGAFIQIKEVFGDLSDRRAFVESYVSSLRHIRAEKIMDCVKLMNSSQSSGGSSSEVHTD